MSVKSFLTTYGQIGTEVLKQAVAPHDATGRTRESIRFVVDEEDEALRFYARDFFHLLEKGIAPSKKQDIKPSKEMIDFMTEYAQARGMDDPKKAAWGISVNQLNKGDKTHNQGGRVVYSDVMDTFARDLKEAMNKDFKKTIVDGINRIR